MSSSHFFTLNNGHVAGIEVICVQISEIHVKDNRCTFKSCQNTCTIESETNKIYRFSCDVSKVKNQTSLDLRDIADIDLEILGATGGGVVGEESGIGDSDDQVIEFQELGDERSPQESTPVQYHVRPRDRLR